MKFTTKMCTRGSMALAMIASMRAVSFAGNTISDVPTSPSENRTIQTATSLYAGTCDITQDLGFYEKSPVYLRVAQPKGPVSYVFDKTATYVIVYGGNVLGNNLKFPYVSNFVPSTTIDTSASNILTVDATGGMISGGIMTTPRNQVAGQVVTKNEERSVIQSSAGATLNYYYKRSSDLSNHNGTMKISINPNLTIKTSCTNYYIARCGDGIIDKATGSSDGNGGITNQAGTFLPWHTRSVKPNEVCDDGPLNGQPGKCNKDCTGNGTGTVVVTGAAGCTITASSSAITAGDPVTINASYTSGANATLTPALSGFSAFTYPNRNGNATDTPATTTTYTLNVQGISGVDNNSCSTTVTVTPPVPHFSCTLTLSPNPAYTGQIVSVGRNVSNGNFFGTYIYVTPPMGGARPHRVNANQYNGVSSVMPTQTGDYLFTMMVNNNQDSATCTGILHVITPIPNPLCQLTTATPTIVAGQTAILSGSYTNGLLATITPNITGLNFIYPNRSNNNIAVTPTSTTTYTMTVLSTGGVGPAVCSTTVNVINPKINFSKSLVTNIPYHSGDLVTFKIDFSNVGTSAVNNVIISDYLPAALDYVSSQIVGVAPYTFGTGVNGGNQFVEYSGFSLAAGQPGYVVVIGRFKGYNYSNQTLNNAFFKSDEVPMLYSAAMFYAYTPSGNASIIKTSNKTSYYPGEDTQFTLAVTNNGPDPISNVNITDTWPTTTCVTPDSQWTSNIPLTMTTTTNPYTWNYNGSLAVGQTIYLYLTGHTTNSPSCVGNYVNNAGINYVINGTTQTGIATPLNFAISTTPTSTMSFQKKLVSYGNNSGDPAVFELDYQNNGTATITNYDITDYRPGTLNFVSANPMPTTQVPNVGGMILHRVFTTPLVPNGSGKIIVNGTIK